jgi:hypothetical protein
MIAAKKVALANRRSRSAMRTPGLPVPCRVTVVRGAAMLAIAVSVATPAETQYESPVGADDDDQAPDHRAEAETDIQIGCASSHESSAARPQTAST